MDPTCVKKDCTHLQRLNSDLKSCFHLHQWDSGARLSGLPGAWDFPCHHDLGKGSPLWGRWKMELCCLGRWTWRCEGGEASLWMGCFPRQWMWGCRKSLESDPPSCPATGCFPELMERSRLGELFQWIKKWTHLDSNRAQLRWQCGPHWLSMYGQKKHCDIVLHRRAYKSQVPTSKWWQTFNFKVNYPLHFL